MKYTCKKCSNNFNKKEIYDKHVKRDSCGINLYEFGKDGIDAINADDIMEIFKSDRDLFEILIININFSQDKPQHHNVFYPEIRSEYGIVYENKKWVKKDIDEIINTMMNAKVKELRGILDLMSDLLLESVVEKIENIIKDAHPKSKYRKNLMKHLRPVLYESTQTLMEYKNLAKENPKLNRAISKIISKANRDDDSE